MERGDVERSEAGGGVLEASIEGGGEAFKLSVDKRGKPKFTLSDPNNDSLINTGDDC